MNQQRFVLLGLPGSGKTTFLAALWAVLNNGTANGEIVLGPLRGEQRYLNRIRQDWLRYTEMERTLPPDETDLAMPLQVRATKQDFTLQIPELAGENYQKAWETRELPQKVVDLLTQADGLALFISSDQVEKPVRMDQARAALFGLVPAAFAETVDEDDEDDPKGKRSKEAAKGEPAKPSEDADEKPAPESKPWRHEMAPTQVILVELLQFAEQLRPLRRLAVVISAWDEVIKHKAGDTPETWLKRELPLLWQFLQRNPGELDHRVFGVSAQGGDYEADFDRLSGMSPALRPKAFDAIGNELDELVAPLKWLPT